MEMIEIRFSALDSMDVSGTVLELQTLREGILGLPRSSSPQVSFDADDSIDPAPYESALSKLVVTLAAGPTKISIVNGCDVHISGSQHSLDAFASFFDFGIDAEPGTHSHYEYYEGNDLIAPDSVPLVISVK